MPQIFPIRFPLSNAPGLRPQEGGGRLINCFAEPLSQDSGPAPGVWRRTPGLTSFCDLGFTGFRGAFQVINTLYVAALNRLLTVDAGGNVTNVGSLAGSQKVFFARNNLAGTPQVACVTENGAFVLTSSSITSWPGAVLPVPNSVCFQDGYFFFTIGDRRVFASDINSTNINALSFITCESKSQDSLLRAVPFNGLLFLFLTSSIEVWQDTANAYPAFPYTRMTVLQRGLAGAHAVAGHEDGFGHTLMWVADDNGVYRLNGMTPEKVSPPDLDRLIRAVSDKSTIEAFVYTHSGHPIWCVSSPTWTWEFDLNTEKWHERLSGMFPGARWRATGNSQLAFGKWMMGDTQSSKLIYIDDDSYQELGSPQLWRMESGPVTGFPDRLRVARADFSFVTGVGVATGTVPIQTDPNVMISWSDDSGVTWSNPVLRKLGTQQKSKTRVTVLNTGMSGPQGRQWRMDVADPVYVGFMLATQSTDVRKY